MYTVKNTNPDTVTATFTAQYRLNLSFSPNYSGSIYGVKNGEYYSGSVTLAGVQTNNIWGFSKWSGDATGNTNPLTVAMDGPKNITANFIRVINKINTITTIKSNDSDVMYGKPVTFTATVKPLSFSSSTLDGKVILIIDDIITDTKSLSSGTATFTTVPKQLDVGHHSVQAVYLGNSSYNGSNSQRINQEVDRIKTMTNVSVPPTIARNTTVTIIATVTAEASSTEKPNGTVTFRDGDTVLAANVQIVNGVASCTVSFSRIGIHIITAFFNDGSEFQGSFDAATTIVTPGKI
jgi:hypothetical protein